LTGGLRSGDENENADEGGDARRPGGAPTAKDAARLKRFGGLNSGFLIGEEEAFAGKRVEPDAGAGSIGKLSSASTSFASEIRGSAISGTCLAFWAVVRPAEFFSGDWLTWVTGVLGATGSALPLSSMLVAKAESDGFSGDSGVFSVPSTAISDSRSVFLGDPDIGMIGLSTKGAFCCAFFGDSGDETSTLGPASGSFASEICRGEDFVSMTTASLPTGD
jgi:hypothetical protein